MKHGLLAAAAIAVFLVGGVAVPSLRWDLRSGNSATASHYDGDDARRQSLAESAARTSAELRVTIHGFRSATGTVLIGLYDSQAPFERAIEMAGDTGFTNDPDRVAGAALRANAALTSTAVFTDLPPGRYAIIVFHDENGSGKLDKNILGVPLQPYGFSNDAQGFLGPPSFDDAMIKLGTGNQVIDINLIYHEIEGEASPAQSQSASVGSD